MEARRFMDQTAHESTGIWNPAVECASREKIRSLQLNGFKNTLSNVYQHVPFYRERLKNAGIEPEKISSLQDIEHIPFTVKDDLRENYPYGLFAVPMREVVRVHASSGTTGKPTVVGYTKADLAMWSELISRLIYAAGGGPDDIAQIAFGYGLFTGAFGLHYGLENVGATVVPISSGNTEKQIMIMKDFGTTLLVSTPSYALYIGEMLEKAGVKDEVRLRVGMFGGEAMSEGIREQVERTLGIVATQNYGLSEIIGPGVSGECTHKCGMHIAEDHFLCEIIDPDTGRVLPLGETGELVITTLTKQAFPLLRYRTRDITRLIPEKCACGRTSMRMQNVQGRSDDMLIIRGVNVFPSQIEEVLHAAPEVGPHYEIIVRREKHLDTLEVRVELVDTSLLESFGELEALSQRIRHNLRVVLGLDARVSLVEPASLQRFEGKAKRVSDLRGK